MVLDPSAKDLNVKRSFKKHFVDGIETGYGITVSFDKSLSAPSLQGIEVNRWVSIRIGAMEKGSPGYANVDLDCCTRGDAGGVVLSAVVDAAMDTLSDTSQTDGLKRIVLYDTSAIPWTNIGGMVVSDVVESEEMDGPDETKYKVISCLIQWGAKI